MSTSSLNDIESARHYSRHARPFVHVSTVSILGMVRWLEERAANLRSQTLTKMKLRIWTRTVSSFYTRLHLPFLIVQTTRLYLLTSQCICKLGISLTSGNVQTPTLLRSLHAIILSLRIQVRIFSHLSEVTGEDSSISIRLLWEEATEHCHLSPSILYSTYET